MFPHALPDPNDRFSQPYTPSIPGSRPNPDWQMTQVSLNPLFVRLPAPKERRFAENDLECSYQRRRVMKTTGEIAIKDLPVFAQLYLTNPPCKKMILHATMVLKRKPTVAIMPCRVVATNPKGLKVADLVRAVRPKI